MYKDNDISTRKLVCCIAALMMIMIGARSGHAAQQEDQTRKVIAPPSQHVGVSMSTCGDEMVFDRNSGRMIRQTRIDLIVEKVEMRRTDSGGIAVKPTIRNRCPDSTGREVSVAIGDTATPLGTMSGNTSYTLGHWILIGDTGSVKVKVDSANNIKEVNESNNVCNALMPRGARARTHRCSN